MNMCQIRKTVTDVLLDVRVFEQLSDTHYIQSQWIRATSRPVGSKHPITAAGQKYSGVSSQTKQKWEMHWS